MLDNAEKNETTPNDKKISDSLENVNTTEKDDTKEAIDAVEKSVAEDAENSSGKEEKSTVDYSDFSLEKLVSSLKKVLKENPVYKVKSEVDAIKNAFNKKFGALLAEKKEAFLAEGGNSIDFQYNSPIKSEYNQLLSDHRKERDAYYKDLEKRLSENLEKRLNVIEALKHLIKNADTKTMYNDFRELQNTWKAIGPVSKTRYNDTWKTYHFHVERFYDLLHLSKDFRDLDFKQNLEEKIKIIEKAEALAEENDVNKASKELQELHRAWKEDIGPVSKEFREDIWKKFSAATKKIHDRRHDYFKELRSKYQEIIDKKLKVVAQINAYNTSNNKTHKDWQKSITEIENLRQQYFDAGKLPYNKSEEIWQKFKAATKKFNTAKNAFYKKEKSIQQENLQKKLKLIEIAESLKDSEDWNMATNAMKKIQADWKKIGHVPRKFSDDVWTRFKGACNHYFDRLHQQKNTISKEQQDVIDAKKLFLEEFKNIKKPTKNFIFEAIQKWKELGHLPKSARYVNEKFNKQLDIYLEKLSIDKKEVDMLKFKNIVDAFLEEKNIKKLNSEAQFVRKKLDEVTREIQQLENNLSFFTNSDSSNPLVVNVKKQVDDYQRELDVWKEKLNYLKKLDY